MDPFDPLVVLDAFARLGGHDRDEAFMAVEREIRRLSVVRAAMIAAVADSLSFVDDGHRSPTSWVHAVSNCARGSAVHDVQTAAMLQFLPEVAAAALAGAIGCDQLRLFVRLYGNPRCRDLLPASEALLVGHATALTWREFKQVCQRWEAHADPDGALAEHTAAVENRSASYTQSGAGYELPARGDALSGEIFNQILDEHTQAELEADIARRQEMYGERAAEYPLARTARQRRHDALMVIGLKAAGRAGGTDREPLVVIHCNAPTLLAALQELIGDTTVPTEVSRRMRLCETQSGAPVSLPDLAIAALVGQVQRIVTDPAGRTIDLGRRSRLFVGAARDAVLLAGDRCCWPGCDLRTGHIQVDHITPWAAKAGTTSPANGAPACPHHNRHKHTGRFTVMRDETGWHHFRPDGTEIARRATR